MSLRDEGRDVLAWPSWLAGRDRFGWTLPRGVAWSRKTSQRDKYLTYVVLEQRRLLDGPDEDEQDGGDGERPQVPAATARKVAATVLVRPSNAHFGGNGAAGVLIGGVSPCQASRSGRLLHQMVMSCRGARLLLVELKMQTEAMKRKKEEEKKGRKNQVEANDMG